MKTLALLIVLGCAKSYGDAAPFPCPSDGICPGEFSCIDGKCACRTTDNAAAAYCDYFHTVCFCI